MESGATKVVSSTRPFEGARAEAMVRIWHQLVGYNHGKTGPASTMSRTRPRSHHFLQHNENDRKTGPASTMSRTPKSSSSGSGNHSVNPGPVSPSCTRHEIPYIRTKFCSIFGFASLSGVRFLWDIGTITMSRKAGRCWGTTSEVSRVSRRHVLRARFLWNFGVLQHTHREGGLLGGGGAAVRKRVFLTKIVGAGRCLDVTNRARGLARTKYL